VSVFTVASNGTLTALPGPPFLAGGSFPRSVAFSPGGGLLATAVSGIDAVTMFSVAADGALTQVASPFATGTRPYSVAFSPDGRLLATANSGSDNVSVFTVAANGRLTPVSGSPFATGSSPYSVAFSPGGRLLAAANSGSDNASVFLVAADGALTPLSGSPIPVTASNPLSVAFSPTGGLLATANTLGNSVSVLAPPKGFEIAKTADRGTIAPGQVLKYTITLRPATLAGGTGSVSDDLSAVLDRASYQHDAHASSGTVAFDAARQQLTWNGTLTAGQQATITYSVKVNDSAKGLLANGVSGPPGSSCTPPAQPQPPCIVETPILRPPAPGADLALSKTASTTTAAPGGQVSYVLAVRNDGPRDATGVTVEDPIPSGLFFQAAQPSEGTCTITAERLRCQVGALPSGGQALVSLTATVAADAAGTLVNQAIVYGDQGDPDPSNDVARSTIDIRPLPAPPNANPGPQPVSDLGLTSQVSAHARVRLARSGGLTVLRGERVTYTVNVTNHGPHPASDVRVAISSRLPVKIYSVHATRGTCNVGRPIRCSLGTLASGAKTTITIRRSTLRAGAQATAAVVTSASWDPNTKTNIGITNSTVLAVLGLNNTASGATVPAGSTVMFTLNVSNHNGTTVHHVRTCATLPARLLYLTASPTPSPSGAGHCWTATSLANNKSKTYAITAQIPFGVSGTATNTAATTALAATTTNAKATIHITAQSAIACPASHRQPPRARAAC
jgi:uncharacterized repeat protein (TIGR01451 family)